MQPCPHGCHCVHIHLYSALRRVEMGRAILRSQRTTAHGGDPSAHASKTREAPSSRIIYLMYTGCRKSHHQGPHATPHATAQAPLTHNSVLLSRLALRDMPPYNPVVCPSIRTHRYRMCPLTHVQYLCQVLWIIRRRGCARPTPIEG